VKYTIRLATPADASTLAGMRYDFRTSLQPARDDRDAFVDRAEAWMRDRLKSPDWRAWVATDGDRILGNIWLHRMEKMPNPVGEAEAIGYITNTFVLPDLQSSGIGSALLRAVIEFSERNGYHTLVLWPAPRSRAFYERQGFAVRKARFTASASPRRQSAARSLKLPCRRGPRSRRR
jgi:GNAT superfamily N-acetyltransferase